MESSAASRPAPPLPLIARLLRAIILSGMRGSTRLSGYLASVVPALHRVPLQVATGQVLCLDMREPWCRDLLCEPLHEGPPRWEPDEQEAMRRLVRRGEVAFDVGANFGQHCPLLAELVGPDGRLVAFEPDPARAGPLEYTLAQRGNGRLLPYALSDRAGRQTLFLPADRSMSSLADWTAGKAGAVRTITCEVVPLDVLIEGGEVPAPDFIKCDVEGAEFLVFRGAARTLNRADAPIVLYEANEPASEAFGWALDAATHVLASLPAACYSFFWVRPGGELERLDLTAFPAGVALLNLVAIPASKLDRLT